MDLILLFIYEFFFSFLLFINYFFFFSILELEGVYNLLINYIHKNKKDALINKFIEPFLTTELTGKPTYYLNV